MPLPATAPRIDLTHARISATLAQAKTRRVSAYIAAVPAMTAGALRADLLLYLTKLAQTCPPPGVFPPSWVDGMVAYAAANYPLYVGDWLADYTATADAIGAALAAAQAADAGQPDDAGIDGTALLAALQALAATLD